MEKKITKRNYNNLLERIAEILNQARSKVVREINKAQVLAYWEIGREIVEFEQKGKARAEYGKEVIVRLAKDMTHRFGKGFSERNLWNMKAFYLNFPILQTLSAESSETHISQTLSDESSEIQKSKKLSRKTDQFEPILSWSHYCELLKVEEPLARSFYEQGSIQNNWSVRELKRQGSFPRKWESRLL